MNSAKSPNRGQEDEPRKQRQSSTDNNFFMEAPPKQANTNKTSSKSIATNGHAGGNSGKQGKSNDAFRDDTDALNVDLKSSAPPLIKAISQVSMNVNEYNDGILNEVLVGTFLASKIINLSIYGCD